MPDEGKTATASGKGKMLNRRQARERAGYGDTAWRERERSPDACPYFIRPGSTRRMYWSDEVDIWLASQTKPARTVAPSVVAEAEQLLAAAMAKLREAARTVETDKPAKSTTKRAPTEAAA